MNFETRGTILISSGIRLKCDHRLSPTSLICIKISGSEVPKNGDLRITYKRKSKMYAIIQIKKKYV